MVAMLSKCQQTYRATKRDDRIFLLPDPPLKPIFVTDLPKFRRLDGYVFNHVLTRPNATAWYVRQHDRFVPISYRVVGASIFVIQQWLRTLRHDPLQIVITCKRNDFAWMALDIACDRLNLIHASIDPRTTSNEAGRYADRIDKTALMITDQDRVLNLNSDADAPRWHAMHSESNLIAQAETSVRDHWKDVMSLAEVCQRDSQISDDQFHGPARMLMTSGSTADAKPVVLSHANLIWNALGKLDAMPQTNADCRLNLLPFSHAYARTCELTTWAITGGSMVCAASTAELRGIAETLHPQLLNAVPAVFDRIVREFGSSNNFTADKLLGGKLRMLASGGAPLSAETFNDFRSIGLPIHQGYGLTETSPVVCSNRFGEVTDNSIGPPIINVDVRTDADGQMLVRGPNIALGYWDAATRQPIRFKLLDDGWFPTGDLASPFETGSWRIVGRIDDRITLASGYKVDPQPLENLFRTQFALHDCMLFENAGQLEMLVVMPAQIDQAKLLLRLQSVEFELPLQKDFVPKIFHFYTPADVVQHELKTAKGIWRRNEFRIRNLLV